MLCPCCMEPFNSVQMAVELSNASESKMRAIMSLLHMHFDWNRNYFLKSFHHTIQSQICSISRKIYFYVCQYSTSVLFRHPNPDSLCFCLHFVSLYISDFTSQVKLWLLCKQDRLSDGFNITTFNGITIFISFTIEHWSYIIIIAYNTV